MTDKRLIPLGEVHGHHAISALPGAGLHQPPPRAAGVAALADARRTVAAHQARGELPSEWLASEIRVHGIRENAAALAVMGVPEYRHQVAQAYTQGHPDRRKVLNDVLAVFTSGRGPETVQGLGPSGG